MQSNIRTQSTSQPSRVLSTSNGPPASQNASNNQEWQAMAMASSTSNAQPTTTHQPGLFGRMFGRSPASQPPSNTTNPPAASNTNQNPGQPINGAPTNTAPPPQQQQGLFGRMFGRKGSAATPPGANSPPPEFVPQLPLPPLTRLNFYIRITQAWAIYLTLVPVVISTILKETSFFLYVLLGCLGWSVSLVINALVLYYWPKRRIEPCYILDVALTLFFAGTSGASLGGGSTYQTGVVRYFNIAMHGWLGLVMIGSYFSYPWVVQHAKEASPQYVWTSKSFLEVVSSLTLHWSISQFLTAGLCVVPLFVGTGLLMDPIALVFNYIWPILTLVAMLCITRWFPDFARRRWYLPRLHSSAVKPMPDAEMGFQQPVPVPLPGSLPAAQIPQPQPQLGLKPQFGLDVDANSRPINRSLQPQFGLGSEEPVIAPPPPFRLASELSNSSLEAPLPLRTRDKAPLVVPHLGKLKTDQKPDGFGLMAEKGTEKGTDKKMVGLTGKQGFGLAQETNASGGLLKSPREALSRFGMDSEDSDVPASKALPLPQPRKFGLLAEEDSHGRKDKPKSPSVSSNRQPLPSLKKPASKSGFGLDAE